MPESGLSIAVLLGSMRRDRIGIRPARFVLAEAARRGHRATLVDALELGLPLLDRMYKEHPAGEAPGQLEELARLFRAVDAFVIVAGEYNHGIQPGLKNLLDHFLEEYFWRPSAIVCYSVGMFGGVRAAMQLRMTLCELGMPSIPSLLPVPRAGKILAEDGTPADEVFTKRAGRFFDELEWYARALAAERAKGTPY